MQVLRLHALPSLEHLKPRCFCINRAVLNRNGLYLFMHFRSYIREEAADEYAGVDLKIPRSKSHWPR